MENQAVWHMCNSYHLLELSTGSIICWALCKMETGGASRSKLIKNFKKMTAEH